MTEWHGGKGSRQRKLQVSNETFSDNWSRIYGDKGALTNDNKETKMKQVDDVFHVLAAGKDEVMARQHRDKHCYIAGKEAANMKLIRKEDVQYTDERDQQMFNMGWTSGEL